jgi:dihydroflavonol-4-reductase
MTTLITGGSGFLGSHLVRALAKRGDALRLLARRDSQLGHLEGAGVEFERTTGDISDRRAVRRAMASAERVFHCAGTTSMGRGSDARVFDINVLGTRIVMEEALRAGVERVVYTSSAGALGPAEPGGTADETQAFTAGRLGIVYINSKHEAEAEAFRVAAQGLPLIVLNPTFVLGPDDPSGTSNRLIRRVLLRQIPFYVEGGLNVVDVRDVAAAHLDADRKGEVGERYILGGRNFTFGRLFADIGRISGVPPPPVKVPLGPTRVIAAAGRRVGFPVAVTDDELVAAGQWWTYRSTKAKRELGWKPRPHEETLEDAVRWQMEQLGERLGRAPRSDLALRALGRALRVWERFGIG